MQDFTIRHKYCGITKKISGYDIYDAFKKCDIDFKYWLVIE